MSRLSADESSRRILAAERGLANKKDIKLVNNKIFILNGKDTNLANDVGIKGWGQVDCLTNYGGYYKYSVANFKELHLAK